MEKQIKLNFIFKFHILRAKIVKAIKLFILNIYLKLNGIKVKDNISIDVENVKLNKAKFVYYITFRNKFYDYEFFRLSTLRDVKRFLNKLNNAVSLKELLKVFSDSELDIDNGYIKEKLHRFKELFNINIVDRELIDGYFTLIGEATNTKYIRFKDILTDIKQFIDFEYIVIDL